MKRVSAEFHSKHNLEHILKHTATNKEPSKLISTVDSVQSLLKGSASLYTHIGDLVRKLDAIKAAIDFPQR